MRTMQVDPAALLIVGAGVSGCALTARLRQLGWGGAITLVEAGQGAGGRAASRRSRKDPAWALDHGAPFLNLTAPDPPALLQPLLAGGRLRPWAGERHGSGPPPLRQLREDGSLEDLPGPLAAAGPLYRGCPAMADLAEGLLELAGTERQAGGVATAAQPLQRIHGRRVERLEHRDGLWHLHDAAGQPLAAGRWLVLSGTLLAHPRCRALLGWSEVPLVAASRQLGDAVLDRALRQIAALRYDPRLALLLRLEADQADPWRSLPFRHLWFSEGARRRWGLERINLQPHPDGRCGVVAQARPQDLIHCGLLDRDPGNAALAGATAAQQAAEREAQEIEALSTALLHGLQPWIRAGDLPPAGGRQRMLWGGAFPLAPGLEAEAMVCPASQLAFCGDAIEGPGFARVEGAWRSGEWLAERLLPALTGAMA